MYFLWVIELLKVQITPNTNPQNLRFIKSEFNFAQQYFML